MAAANQINEESEEEAAPGPGLVLRLKRLLVAPLLLLRRLRRPPAEEADGEEAAPSRSRVRGGEAEGAAETQAGPPLWRRVLPHLLVLLVGAAIGGGTIFWLSAQVIARQSAELGERQEEIVRLKGMLAGYDKMMLKNRKKLEEAQGQRAELENRLALAQTSLTRRPSAGNNPGAGEQAGSGAGKAMDCRLRPGTIGSTLKSCLEEFNR